MPDLKIEGFLKTVAATESVGTNGFEKRDFVITTDEQYPQTLLFQLQQGKVNDIDQYTIGEKMSVAFNLRGREWVNPQGETKVFNTLQAWQLAHVAGAAPAPQAQAAATKTYKHTDTAFTLEQYRANKWTDEQLVSGGKGVWVTAAPPAAPVAPSAPPVAPAPATANADDPHYDLPF